MTTVTNRGKAKALNAMFAGDTYFVALVTGATVPNADTNTLGQLTQMSAGNGYISGGKQVTGYTVTEDDVNGNATAVIDTITWTASGGVFEAGGDPPRYAVLTDDNATVSSREVYAWYDMLTSAQIANSETDIGTQADGTQIEVAGLAVRLT